MSRIKANLKRLFKEKKGAAAIEFAMLILPFSLAIFMIMEVALLFFVDSSLDSALHKTSRSVRVGTAQDASNTWDLAKFKSELCSNMAYYFDCSSSLLVTSTVVSDLTTVSHTDPVVDGELNVTEGFDPGEADDYVLIQAFIPWEPVLPMFGIVSDKLNDGRYILSAAVLFKNEPF